MKSLLESGMTDYRKILFLTFSILLFTSSVSAAYSQEEPKTYSNYRAYDYNGNTVRISDLEGQVVLLNVWATWCMECLEEMPYLNELNKEYSPSGLKTLSVSIDTLSPDIVKEFADDMDMTTDIWYDPRNNATREFRMMGPPITLLINENGELISEGNIVWAFEAEKELKKIPFFVRGKARRNTERFAEEQGISTIQVDTLYDAKAHFSS